MNTSLIALSIAVLVLALPGEASAAESNPLPEPTTTILIDCAKRVRPSQREVGELLDQHNPSQVYASRARLMTEVARACHRKGVAKVLLVPASPAGTQVDRSVASQGSR